MSRIINKVTGKIDKSVIGKSGAKTSEDPMVVFVRDQMQIYESYWKDHFKEANSIYDHWDGKPPKRDYPHQNAIHVPVTIEAEQTITPRLHSALFPNDAPISVQEEGMTTLEQANIVKGAIQHYFRRAKVKQAAYPAIGQMTLFGTGYVDMGSWYVKSAWKEDELGRYYDIVESRPDAKWVDFFEIMPHPAKRSVCDGLPLIRKRNIDAEMLKTIGEELLNAKNIQEALDSKHPAPEFASDKSPLGRQYELAEYWGPWKTTYTKGEDTKTLAVPYWIMVINRKIVIRAIPNPFPHQNSPYCKIILFPDLKPSWFGVGTGKIGLSTQERLNKMVNQRLDNVDLVLNQQGVYDGNDPMINTRKLQVSKPGQFHRVSDTNASIKWIPTPDVTKSSYEEEKIAKDDFRTATGAVAPLMPAEKGEQHRTAMGINMLQSAAGIRFKPILDALESDLITVGSQYFLGNLSKFMGKREWITLMSDFGKKQPWLLDPSQLTTGVQFIPMGVSETLEKEEMVGQLLRFKELTVNDPTINRQEINRRIAELMGFKDIEKLMVPQVPQRGYGILDPAKQLLIQQRMAEGATPETIKSEMLGNAPQPEAPQPQQGGQQ